MDKVLVASHNEGKIREFREMLGALGIQVVSAAELKVSDVEETGETFAENAILKAEAMSKEVGLPCIADDSGLCVDALGGRPGVHTARYAPNRDFGKGQDMLLSELEGKEGRAAHFMCVIALAVPGEKTKVFEGRVDGTIAFEKMGDGGFGYDPIFIPEGYRESFGMLGSEVKHKMSHRARALKALMEYLKG